MLTGKIIELGMGLGRLMNCSTCINIRYTITSVQQPFGRFLSHLETPLFMTTIISKTI